MRSLQSLFTEVAFSATDKQPKEQQNGIGGFMITRILNRELGSDEAGHPIPATGEHYVPMPEGKENGLVTGSAVQTIQGDPKALYAFWRDVTFIPRWQEHVVSVTPIDSQKSHWVMGNPEDEDGKRIEFDSQITEDIPGEKISWQSIGGDVEQGGTVTFSSSASGRGTLVTLIQSTNVPLGTVGNAIAGVAKRSPRQTVIEDLRHFKQMVETGEIPSVKGQPHGPRGISGGIKEWMYGETNPTPPGSNDQA
jgi:uncharacterized membrane protein